MEPDYTVYRRNELYAQVWDAPVSAVARRYGVSDVALAKACRRLGVPLPGRGYWAKERADKAPPRPSLPPQPKGAPLEIPVQGHSTRIAASPTRKPSSPAAARSAPKVTVSPLLENPHPLVAQAARRLPKLGQYNGLYAAQGEDCLDLRVSPGSLDRALRIADALLRALREAKLRTEVTAVNWSRGRSWHADLGDPKGSTRVLCDGEWLSFALTEKLNGKPIPPPDPARQRTSDGWTYYTGHMEYVPSGRLALSITNERVYGARTLWQDGKRQRLEDCLGHFIAELPVAAQAIKLAREKRRQQELLWAQEKQRRAEVAAARLAQERREEELRATVARWRLARDIREYARDAADAIGGLQPGSEVSRRLHEELAWTLDYADRIDLLTSLRRQSDDEAATDDSQGEDMGNEREPDEDS